MRAFVASDLAEINRWYTGRGVGPIGLEHLPAYGQIVPGVTAGFLYLTDSSIALLEGFITNPLAGLHERSRAIDWITAALYQEAKRRGVCQLVGFTATRGLERRVNKLGMRSIGSYTMVARSV